MRIQKSGFEVSLASESLTTVAAKIFDFCFWIKVGIDYLTTIL